MEIITSNKGCEKLCYNGYMYVLKHFGKSKITWRCSKRSSFKCMGELYTNVQKEDPVLKSNHNHFGDSEKEMNQNGFSTGEEDSRGPLDKICCLQEDGFRCQRQAGNASYSKKIRNTVRQLKLHLDAVARHIYICDHHKSMIQSARTLKPSSQDEAPEVDFSQLQMNTLRRYKKHFKVVTKPSLNKAQMAEALLNHFKTISVNEKEALTFFIYTIKTNGNKLDQKNGNNNSDTPS
ncbi:hypothetical protein ACI65C_007821 [Semiaphis heraclei]